MYWCIMYCYMTHHPSSCIDALCIVTWPTTLHHVFMHYVLLHDPPPFIMYSCIMYCYMTHHPSSCIDALCIVTWPTTLHHVLMHYVLLHRAPPFIIVKVIRNSEVLTIPTSFDYISTIIYIVMHIHIIVDHKYIYIYIYISEKDAVRPCVLHCFPCSVLQCFAAFSSCSVFTSSKGHNEPQYPQICQNRPQRSK